MKIIIIDNLIKVWYNGQYEKEKIMKQTVEHNYLNTYIIKSGPFKGWLLRIADTKNKELSSITALKGIGTGDSFKTQIEFSFSSLSVNDTTIEDMYNGCANYIVEKSFRTIINGANDSFLRGSKGKYEQEFSSIVKIVPNSFFNVDTNNQRVFRTLQGKLNTEISSYKDETKIQNVADVTESFSKVYKERIAAAKETQTTIQKAKDSINNSLSLN